MKKLFLVFALTAMLAFSACGSDENGEVRGQNSNTPAAVVTGSVEEMVYHNTTVATVDGIPLGAGDMVFRIADAEFTTNHLTDGLSDEERSRIILEEAVRISAVAILFANYAQQHGIELTADEVEMLEAEIEDITEWYGEDVFEAELRSDGIRGLRHFTRLYSKFTLLDKVIDTIIADPEKFAEFEQFMEPEVVLDEELFAAKHILITLATFDDDAEAAMEFAREIWQRAVDGEDFDSLIAQYGEDPGMFENPDGYTFVSGVMVAEFEDTTRSLQIGEMSEPFLAFHGIHIVLRVEPNPDDVMRPWGFHVPTREQRMAQAIFAGFEYKVENAEFVFLPELYAISVDE